MRFQDVCNDNDLAHTLILDFHNDFSCCIAVSGNKTNGHNSTFANRSVDNSTFENRSVDNSTFENRSVDNSNCSSANNSTFANCYIDNGTSVKSDSTSTKSDSTSDSTS